MQQRSQRDIRVMAGVLAASLLGLSGFALWSSSIAQRQADDAGATFQRADLYQQGRSAVAQEVRAYWQSTAQTSTADQAAALTHASASFTAMIHHLARSGVAKDQLIAKQFQHQNSRLVQIIRASWGTGRRLVGSPRQNQAGVMELSATLDQALAAASHQDNLQVSDNLATLMTQATIGQLAALIIFLLSLTLLASLWFILRSYRQNTSQATQQEVQRLEHVVLIDQVTNLGNHRAFQEDVQREVARARRHGESVALALIDLDDFKIINDQHGHAHGDRVLAAVGTLLHSGRADDRPFRLGGDEFALILPDTSEQTAAIALERIRRSSEQSLLGATLSIGVAALATGETDVDMLREQAEAALFEAKHRGRNSVVAFDDIRANASILSADKISGVRRLLAEGRIGVAFQPIWDLQRGDIVAFEALTRPDPSYGLAGPMEAFDVAEKIGRAPELDALRRQAILSRANELPSDALLFLNLLPQSLDHPLLAGDMLLDEVRRAGLTPDQVVLEITERSLARPAVVITEAKRLRELGFCLALDDVGSGNSGLEMLRQLPVDFVKIDRAVVADALTDTAARSVLVAIIAFARESHAFVIAEGIETTTMLELVQQSNNTNSNNVHGAQGYLLGRPSSTIPSMSEMAGYTVLARTAAAS